jgi:hypothetical membrane protein
VLDQSNGRRVAELEDRFAALAADVPDSPEKEAISVLDGDDATRCNPRVGEPPTRRDHQMTTSTNTRLDASSARQASLATAEGARWLPLGAVAGPVLFTLAWLVLGFLSPGYSAFGTQIAPYSPITQPISGLGMGPTGPFMNAAFVLSGLLLMAGVIGIFQTLRTTGRSAARWACAALLALSPLGLVVDGIFNLEAVVPHLIGFVLATESPVLSFLAAGLFLRTIRAGGGSELGSSSAVR